MEVFYVLQACHWLQLLSCTQMQPSDRGKWGPWGYGWAIQRLGVLTWPGASGVPSHWKLGLSKIVSRRYGFSSFPMWSDSYLLHWCQEISFVAAFDSCDWFGRVAERRSLAQNFLRRFLDFSLQSIEHFLRLAIDCLGVMEGVLGKVKNGVFGVCANLRLSSWKITQWT